MAEYGGQKLCIERIGTDGDKAKAISLIKYYDGKVDAIGLGGTDLYIYTGKNRYVFRETKKIAAAAKITPVVDGSGIKNSLERRVIKHILDKYGIQLKDKQALLVCAVDRFGLAEALMEAGCKLVFGDLIFGLGLPVPIKSINTLDNLAKLLVPVITKLPINFFYPTGDRQNYCTPKYSHYFEDAYVIAGDFHFISRYMPQELRGKIMITNTVTQEDEILLKARGVAILVTTTPEMGGRSFGTNLLEAIIIAIAGKKPEELTAQDYWLIMDEIGVEARVKYY